MRKIETTKEVLFAAFRYYAGRSISNQPYNEEELNEEFEDWFSRMFPDQETGKDVNYQPVEGGFYWVKFEKKDDYEIARAADYYGNGVLYFKFSNGGIAEVARVFDWNPNPVVYSK